MERYDEGMDEDTALGRIVSNPRVLRGKPVIRGTRLSVEHVLNELAHGATIQEVLDDHPGIAEADVLACLLFAKNLLASVTFMPVAEAI